MNPRGVTFCLAPRRALPVALVVVSLAALGGCFGGKTAVDDRCDDPAEYQASGTAPDITAPEGLVVPNQTSGFTVPPVPAVAATGAACLARPPDYFRRDPAAPVSAPPAGTAPAPPAPPAPPAT